MPTPSPYRFHCLQATALGCALMLAACGSDRVLAPPLDVTGNFTLRQVNGGSLPSTVSNDGTSRVDITAGAVEVEDDSTWTSRTDFRIITPGGTQLTSQDAGGRWRIVGDSLRFNEQGTVAGVVRGDTLFLVRRDGNGDVRYVYTR